MTTPADATDFAEARRNWASGAEARSIEWGRKTAKSLWEGLYEPWIDIADNRSFLDVGCSWGYLFQYMLGECSPRRLVGIDVTAHWEGAPFDWANEKRADIALYHGDIFSAPLADESFDYVLCASVLQNLPPTQIDATLKRMYQLLRPGGELLLRTQVFTSYLGLQLHRVYQLPYIHLLYGEEVLGSRLQSRGHSWRGSTNWLTASSYLSAFMAAGFEILDVHRSPNQHSPTVQDRVLAQFPVSREEMTVSHLAARLSRQ